MHSGILKFILYTNILFIFMTFLWQATSVNASPVMDINDILAQSHDLSQLPIRANNKGGLLFKRSLHLPTDQYSLVEVLPIDSLSNKNTLAKKPHSHKFKKSRNIFRSTGAGHKRLRGSHRVRPLIDDRLKRFRMLDPDEFKEMLNTLSQQMPHENSKGPQNVDTIGGMQVENYWSSK